jgi:hypothetical protein
MGAGLAQRGFGGGDVLAGRIDGGLGGLQAGGRVVPGLLAHDALLGQRDGAAGVGLLVVVVGLRLGQRGLAARTWASALTVALLVSPRVWRSVSTVSPSLPFWLAAVASAALRAAAGRRSR